MKVKLLVTRRDGKSVAALKYADFSDEGVPGFKRILSLRAWDVFTADDWEKVAKKMPGVLYSITPKDEADDRRVLERLGFTGYDVRSLDRGTHSVLMVRDADAGRIIDLTDAMRVHPGMRAHGAAS